MEAQFRPGAGIAASARRVEGRGMVVKVQPTDQHQGVRVGLAFFQALLEAYHPRDCDIRFWDGSTWRAEKSSPARFTVVLNHPGAIEKMFSSPVEVALGEAYAEGDYEIEGDLEAAFRLGDHLIDHAPNRMARLNLGLKLSLLRRAEHASAESRRLSLPAVSHLRKHSQARDRLAVTYHYDLCNDFFKLWLDPRMIYSCAYFASPEQDLATAQENKLDLICRKLQLQRGESFLDIGCGWGGLVIHAARNYQVRATGITLSESQAQLARGRIREAGLSDDECSVRVLDYRQLEEEACFDKVASVGMVEHVGISQLRRYFAHIFQLMKPGGVFLNHGINSTRYGESAIRRKFFDRYVFPDTEMSPLDVVLGNAEGAGFEIRNVESLRQHYVLTLRAWRRNLEKAAGQAQAMVGKETYRIWRLYLAASAYSFDRGHHSVFQSLLKKRRTAEQI
jgi:cyclopropane-fatty-acyl-phospholipid synthase